jgi:hypothetical protein
MAQCIAVTRDGKLCQLPARDGQKYCHIHRRQRLWRIAISVSAIGTIILGLLGFVANMTGVLGYFGVNPSTPTQTPVITIEKPILPIQNEKFEVSGTWAGLPQNIKIWIVIVVEGDPNYWLQKEAIVDVLANNTWRTTAISANQDIGKTLEIIAFAVNDDKSNSVLSEYFSSQDVFSLSELPLKILAENRQKVERYPNELPIVITVIPSKVFSTPMPTPTLCWPPGSCK